MLPHAGVEKYLNSTLPVGQVTLKFCLPGGLLRLPKFSNSLIVHELKSSLSPLSADHLRPTGKVEFKYFCIVFYQTIGVPY